MREGETEEEDDAGNEGGEGREAEKETHRSANLQDGGVQNVEGEAFILEILRRTVRLLHARLCVCARIVRMCVCERESE